MGLYDLFEGDDWVERPGGVGGALESRGHALFGLEYPPAMMSSAGGSQRTRTTNFVGLGEEGRTDTALTFMTIRPRTDCVPDRSGIPKRVPLWEGRGKEFDHRLLLYQSYLQL